ncbi:MAG: thiosulfate oxidation carrier protein SoxY [Gammaproteobacteria bacterium]|nr:thiosulfate oxidation carrier protein SoxY [Gammaproteobacteria bacterium]
MRRRALLRATAFLAPLLRPLRALAQLRSGAFSATSLAEAMRALFGERAPEASDAVTLDVEPKIENGAVVPVQINATVEGVTAINIFAELNPNPLLARFHLSPRCRPIVATRVKVGAPSNIVIVVETEDRLLSTRKFVEVVEGGCG